MSKKITTSSADPAYISFDAWFLQKIEEFAAANNEATADAWLAAMRAKTAAEEAVNAVVTIVDANTSIMSQEVVVEAFDAVFNQWVSQFNVQFAVEEI